MEALGWRTMQDWIDGLPDPHAHLITTRGGEVNGLASGGSPWYRPAGGWAE